MFDAKEYFDSVRVAAGSLEAARTRRDTMVLVDRNGPVGGKTTGAGDPTSTQALALEALDARIAQLEAIVSEANLVINAVGERISQHVALALALYYIELNSWDEIAIEMKWTLSTTYRKRAAALDWLSSIGLAAAREIGSSAHRQPDSRLFLKNDSQ